MTDKEISIIVKLLTANFLHESAIANLLIEKGVITGDELETTRDGLFQERFDNCAEEYEKTIHEMFNLKKEN